MANEVWLPLNPEERTLLREALAAYASIGDTDAVNALSKKIAQTSAYPDITVGVYGGVLQWVTGNPFPIRVCDYDGDEKDLPFMDERGQRCTMGFAQPDTTLGCYTD